MTWIQRTHFLMGRKTRNIPRKVWILGGVVTAILLVIATAVIVTTVFAPKRVSEGDVRLLSDEEVSILTQKVGQLIELPSTLPPTVASVLDKEKLKNQPFFATTENGDKVLLFSDVRTAILYRPSTNKIIKVGELDVSEQTASPPPSGAPINTVKVAILNGVGTDGLAGEFEKTILAKAANAQVIFKGMAKSQTYTETLVVDIAGNDLSTAQQLATLIGGRVVPKTELEEGEVIPEGAEFLIIAGRTAPAASASARPTSSPILSR